MNCDIDITGEARKPEFLNHRLIMGVPDWWVYFCALFLALIVVGSAFAYFENDVRVAAVKAIEFVSPKPAEVIAAPAVPAKEEMHICYAPNGRLVAIHGPIPVGYTACD